MTRTATGTFTVDLRTLPMEDNSSDAMLGRMAIDKRISGDLVATTVGQMLSAGTGTKGSAGYVAIERVDGSLHGRKGTFVLQHHGVMTRGTPSLSVVVVPDSGTGELAGLQGEFKINRTEGRHEYEFVYQLPPAPIA